MSNYFELSEDAFAALFKPKKNHLNPNASFEWGDGYGTLFETYGVEFQYILEQHPARVWTLLSGDGGDFIGNGLHLVNRIGYFVTECEVDAGLCIEVKLENPENDRQTGVDSEVLLHLHRLIDYLWHDEQTHFDELDATMQGKHIFQSIRFLSDWLIDQEPET